MPDVLIHGDTVRSPELRHEVPIAIPDPIVYAERGGERHVLVGSFEIPRIHELESDLVPHAPEEYGVDELLGSGRKIHEIRREVTARFVEAMGITSAVVPPTFPLAVADRLREGGVQITFDDDFFNDRRRSKNATELAGIRRAQRAAEAGMDAARDLLRRAQAQNGAVVLDGEPLTSERIKRAIEDAFTQHGVVADEFIVSHGGQTAIGHDMGSGPIAPGEPVVIDLWPRDRETACYADMTRTFVVGEVSDELREYHRLALEALQRSLAATRAGVRGSELNQIVCDLFHEHGHRTLLNKEEGEVLEDGFFHSLGHGVGLEVHEQPGLSRVGEELVAGDVITLEPGLYRRGYGGCRLEDIVLVTDDGAENLTDYPYDLEP